MNGCVIFTLFPRSGLIVSKGYNTILCADGVTTVIALNGLNYHAGKNSDGGVLGLILCMGYDPEGLLLA